jgi:hypothetical protein
MAVPTMRWALQIADSLTVNAFPSRGKFSSNRTDYEFRGQSDHIHIHMATTASSDEQQAEPECKRARSMQPFQPIGVSVAAAYATVI